MTDAFATLFAGDSRPSSSQQGTNSRHEGGAGTVHANSPAEVPARLEALAALGGLDRGALHSQLASAVQVILHVRRGAHGRRLSEIAVLQRGPAGMVAAVPVWSLTGGRGEGQGVFRSMIEGRRGS